MLFTFLAVLLILPSFVQQAQAVISGGTSFTLFGDTPGDGFESGDACGFVMGSGTSYSNGTLNFSGVTDMHQACADENGNFYSSSTRESYANYTRTGSSTTYVIDFDYSSSTYAYIDYTAEAGYGLWKGSGILTNSTVPAGQKRIDFEWACAGKSLCTGGSGVASDYYVRTDMSTGIVSGYAWSDYFGTFISFQGSVAGQVTMELPPQQIVTYVDILANDTNDGPDDVDYTTAPVADGAEFWRIRVQFLDLTTGEFLDADDIDYMAITTGYSSDTNVYFNQVQNTGDAIDDGIYNPYMGCNDTSASPDPNYCLVTESDDSVSFNKFIFSGAPTDNVLGLNDDTDMAIEYFSDREGCRWIYTDQGTGTRSPAGVADCPDGAGAGSVYDKEDVFFDRQNDRNKIELDYITIQFIVAADRALEVAEYAGTFEEVDDNTWRYYPDDDNDELSFRPRYQITKFVAVYDGEEHTSISEDINKMMSLKTEAYMSNSSDAFLARSGSLKPSYVVYYQMDATSDADDPMNSDLRLLIDTDEPPNSPTSRDVEETTRTDSIAGSSSSYNSYNKNYAIGYGQAYSLCYAPGFTCTAPSNTLTEPTAEQWVCDDATETTMGEKSCYYTEYLPHIDRHKDPESMLVIGAINSTIDEEDLLQGVSDETGEVLSVLGTAETINLRNKMYAQIIRYTLGKTATGGSFESDGTATSGLLSLMNGRLIFAQGDVAINGFDGSDKTLVVLGGNVAINSNIENGKMGIIVFESNGVGGNVYVNAEVTDIHANMFLDGSLFSYAGTVPSGVPSYSSDELRLETVLNQLYLKGSLVARNTVGGASDDTASSFDLGDGTSTSSYGVAREYDLNSLRQYRLCYPIVDGVVVEDDSLTEECEEGEELSQFGQDNGYYNSFILEYDPADELPIFTAESGLFN